MKGRATGQGDTAIRLRPGTHAALLYDDPNQLERALTFLAEGLERKEACVCLAYARFNERLVAQLRDLHSLDTRAAVEQGALALLEGHDNARVLRAELVKQLGKAGEAKRPARLVTCFGWGDAGWPDELDLIQLDAQLNELCAEYDVAALCLYDARQLNGALLLHGALECHPVVFAHGVAHKNPFYLEPATVQREMGARKRDESRLRSWMA